MPTTTAATRPEGGIQAQRRAETRTALLDATIECLVTYGYAKTTTGRIADVAGLSRGAQLPYFRTRADLLAAAVAHLAEQRIAAFTERVGDQPTSVEDCLDALWEGHQPPMFDATLELWVASRGDAELRAHLLKIEGEVSDAIARAADSALGEVARRPGFADDLAYAFASIRGLAMLQVTHGTTSRLVSQHWRHMRSHLLELLGDSRRG
jgi:AcrR family transcriptional regulator